MDPAEAIKKASEILDEELAHPTVQYQQINVSWERSLQEISGVKQNLFTQRQNRPRQVEEVPGHYVFSSVNYNLLTAIFSQLPKADRNAFMSSIVKREIGRASCRERV